MPVILIARTLSYRYEGYFSPLRSNLTLQGLKFKLFFLKGKQSQGPSSIVETFLKALQGEKLPQTNLLHTKNLLRGLFICFMDNV